MQLVAVNGFYGSGLESLHEIRVSMFRISVSIADWEVGCNNVRIYA